MGEKTNSTDFRTNNIDLQKRLWEKWVRRKLQSRVINLTLDDITKLSGYYVIKLTEILSGKKFHGIDRINKTPVTETQKLHSISVALEFLKEVGLNLMKLPSPDDIIIYDSIRMLDIYWYLYENFERYTNDKAINASNSLLLWIKKTLKSPIYNKLYLNNFGDNFKNGIIICALIHNFNQNCLNFDKIEKTNSTFNIKLAFYASEKVLNIEQLMSVREFKELNKKEMCLFISEYYYAYQLAPKIKSASKIIHNVVKFNKNNQIFKNIYMKSIDVLIKKIDKEITILENICKSPLSAKNNIKTKTKELENYKKKIKIDLYSDYYKIQEDENENSLRLIKQHRPGVIPYTKKNYLKLKEKFDLLTNQELTLEKIIHNYYHNSQILSLQNKSHKNITKTLISWANSTRERLHQIPDKSSTLELKNILLEHSLIGLEISDKKKIYTNMIETIENQLIESGLDISKLSEVRERICLGKMFDALKKDWKFKTEKLKDLEKYSIYLSKLEIDMNHYEQIFENVEEEKNKYLMYLKEVVDVEGIEEAMILELDFDIKKEEIMYLIKTNNKHLNSIEESINSTNFSSKSINEKFTRTDFFTILKTKSNDSLDKLKEAFHKKLSEIRSLIKRETKKYMVNLQVKSHLKEANKIINWCDNLDKKVNENNALSIEDVENQIYIIDKYNEEIKYKMKHHVQNLNELENEILSAEYQSTEFSEHYWKFDSKLNHEYTFKKDCERVMVRLAKLSNNFLQRKEKLNNKLKELKIKEKDTIEFNALSNRLKTLLYENNKIIKYIDPLTIKTEIDIIIPKSKIQLIIDEILSKMRTLNIDNKEKEIKKHKKIYYDFKKIYKEKKHQIQSQVSGIYSNNNDCKKFSDKIKEFLDKIEDIRINLCDYKGENDVGQSIDYINTIKNRENFEEKLEEILQLENLLMEKEIKFNPHTNQRYESAKNAYFRLNNFIEKRILILNKQAHRKKFGEINDIKIEEQFNKYAIHKDSKNRIVMSKSSFKECLKEFGDDKNDIQIENILKKYGIISKGDSDRIITFEDFSNFIYSKYGETKTKGELYNSFSYLNNGLPFITKENLEKNIPETDSKYLINFFNKKKTVKNGIFKFGEFIEDIYSEYHDEDD